MNLTPTLYCVWIKQLKSELAALDRKITAELTPKKEEQDGEEVKQQPDTQRVEVRDNRSQPIGSKESMVAEPIINYRFGASVYM